MESNSRPLVANKMLSVCLKDMMPRWPKQLVANSKSALVFTNGYTGVCRHFFGGTPLLMSCCARKQQGMNSWHKNAGWLSSQKGHGMKRLRISLVPRPTVCTLDKYRLFLY